MAETDAAMKSIVLDIEGTTTPIEFVHEVLFPFARKRIPGFVATNFEGLVPEIAQLAAEHQKDLGYTDHFDPAAAKSVAKYLVFLIDGDRKSTPLKSIQGKMWKQGYESGELKSIVFDDVPRAFERWHRTGVTIAIYSSGSVLAQQLLFRYTDHGDLSRFISAYFDTATGPKRSVESYREIVKTLRSPSTLFVSDVPAELEAAQQAGCETILCVRPGNATIGDEFLGKRISSFDEIV
jgi:enolase-phosphatase E1